MSQKSSRMPRIMIAAPRSGSGKTMLTCGLLMALKCRGLKVQAAKCGPDYIDPMFHKKVLGIPTGNLDTFFTDEETTSRLLAARAKDGDITVIEGVMGYYDGVGGVSETASTYDVARATRTPVILVVDGKGASVTLAAVIKGIINFREDGGIKGILLNRVSDGYYERIREMIERECKIPVLGHIPDLPQLAVPSRHLGLVAPEEIGEFRAWAERMAGHIEKYVQVEEILRIASTAEALEIPDEESKPEVVRIGMAVDEAFSFCYEENKRLLGKLGASLVEFSPIHDATLPGNIDGLILSGGYPENFAGELSKNRSMRDAVFKACREGIPVLAECGGFLYLQKRIQDGEGKWHDMVGVLDGEGFPTQKLCRFGYIEGKIRTRGLLGKEGETIRGHEFHYWDCTECGSGFVAEKPMSGRSYSVMVHTETMAAGFPHFYYYSNPKMLQNFIDACVAHRVKRSGVLNEKD